MAELGSRFPGHTDVITRLNLSFEVFPKAKNGAFAPVFGRSGTNLRSRKAVSLAQGAEYPAEGFPAGISNCVPTAADLCGMSQETFISVNKA